MSMQRLVITVRCLRYCSPMFLSLEFIVLLLQIQCHIGIYWVLGIQTWVIISWYSKNFAHCAIFMSNTSFLVICLVSVACVLELQQDNDCIKFLPHFFLLKILLPKPFCVLTLNVVVKLKSFFFFCPWLSFLYFSFICSSLLFH